MHELLDSLTSYGVAFVVLLNTNSDTILAFGGMALLLVRFIADAPRAWSNIKGWFRRDN